MQCKKEDKEIRGEIKRENMTRYKIADENIQYDTYNIIVRKYTIKNILQVELHVEYT